MPKNYFLVAVTVVDLNWVAVMVFVVVTVLVAVLVTGAPPIVVVNPLNTVEVLVTGKSVVVLVGLQCGNMQMHILVLHDTQKRKMELPSV